MHTYTTAAAAATTYKHTSTQKNFKSHYKQGTRATATAAASGQGASMITGAYIRQRDSLTIAAAVAVAVAVAVARS
jgi:hypothetical protein